MVIMDARDGKLWSPAYALALAVLFEAFLVLCTQDKSLMAVTPWQDDPYHAWISLVVFAVPMLLVVTAVRSVRGWLPWGGGDGGQRRDLVKAGVLLTALVASTAVVCWLAVVLHEHRALWDRRTTLLLVSLAALSLASLGVAVAGVRDLTRVGEERRSDWVGDVLPAALAAWVRRHDRLVFLGASVTAAVAIVGALAGGEHWTDPLLIGWALVVEVTCYYAFCVLTNAVLGFVDRPDRSSRTEAAVVLGCLALQAAVAFHGQLEPLAGIGSPDGVSRLVEVTLAPGLLVFAVAYGVSRLRPAAPARPARPGPRPRPWGGRS
jgi:hypothetical protein